MRSQKNAKWITYVEKEEEAHCSYHAMSDHTIIQSTTAGKVDNPETTNCTSIYKHVIK